MVGGLSSGRSHERGDAMNNYGVLSFVAEQALARMDRLGTDSCHIGDDWFNRFECESILGIHAEREIEEDRRD